MFETIIHATCFKQYFTIKTTLCCIQSMIYIDCVEYAFQEKKWIELELLLWHDYYLQLHKNNYIKPEQTKSSNAFSLLPV